MIANTSSASTLWLKRLVIVIFALAILQNLLPPNGFSGTVLIFDYEFGLMRRGLVGEVANFYWGAQASRSEVLTVSVLMSLFGLLCLLGLCISRLFHTQTTLLLALLLVSSFAFKAIVGFTGYMDMILIGFVCLAALSDPNRIFGILIRALAIFVGMFCHEIMLAYFAVFLCVDLWVRRGYRITVSEISLASTPLLAGLAGFAVLSIFGINAAENAPVIVEYINQKADFTADGEATNVIGRSIGDNFALMTEKRFEMGYRSWVILDGMPLAVMMLWMLWVNLRLMSGRFNGLVHLVVVAAILAPQSLNLIAFDVVRFGAISVLVGFLTLMTLIKSDDEAELRLRHILSLPVFIVVMMLNQQFMVTQINTGLAHLYELPWVLLEQSKWFR
ncbi:MAG: hypothetical protein KC451_03455 [Amylibacter sp.]|jgi:hypothetical protein|nr:hypothetical protein [Amylibacter sp.]